MLPCKMINLLQDVLPNFSPQNMNYGWRYPLVSWEQGMKALCNFYDQYYTVEVQKSLIFLASNKWTK